MNSHLTIASVQMFATTKQETNLKTMEEYLIKQLGKQELAYSVRIPGKIGGQYFLVSKHHIDFFPPLSKDILNDLQIINIVSHDSSSPCQA